MFNILLKVSSYDKFLLISQIWHFKNILSIILESTININFFSNKLIFGKRTFNKSPHVDKKARHQSEFRQYSNFIILQGIKELFLEKTLLEITKELTPGIQFEIQIFHDKSFNLQSIHSNNSHLIHTHLINSQSSFKKTSFKSILPKKLLSKNSFVQKGNLKKVKKFKQQKHH